MSFNQTLVGIDVGKFSHAVAVTRDGKSMDTFMVENTPDGREKLLEKFSSFGNCTVALEQVGSWAVDLDQLLLAAGHQVLTIHPLRLAIARNLYGQPHKTDRKDAQLLARMLQQIKLGLIPKPEAKQFRTILLCPKPLQQLKQLSRHYQALAVKKTRNCNQLTKLIFCYLPEFKQQVFKETDAWSGLVLLSSAPCPSQWRRLSKRVLNARMRQAKNNPKVKFIGVKRLKEFIRSGNWRPFDPEIKLQVQHLAQRLLLVRQQQEATKKGLAELMEQLPEGRALMTLPGCSLILGSTILSELSPVERFRSHNQVAAYVGLTKLKFESGLKRGSRKVMLVNRLAKWAFRQLIYLNAQHCPISRIYVKGHLERGRNQTQARLALGRQLVKVVVALIKTKTAFDPKRRS
jgi:transposase